MGYIPNMSHIWILNCGGRTREERKRMRGKSSLLGHVQDSYLFQRTWSTMCSPRLYILERFYHRIIEMWGRKGSKEVFWSILPVLRQDKHPQAVPEGCLLEEPHFQCGRHQNIISNSPSSLIQTRRRIQKGLLWLEQFFSCQTLESHFCKVINPSSECKVWEGDSGVQEKRKVGGLCTPGLVLRCEGTMNCTSLHVVSALLTWVKRSQWWKGWILICGLDVWEVDWNQGAV